MEQAPTLIIGASMSGLACAAALHHQGINYTMIEKGSTVAMPWRNHYERLHLHTHKGSSHLPYKKFAKNVPRYPSRQQVIDYAANYQEQYNIRPVFNTEATIVKKQDGHWLTETNHGAFLSKYLVVATGPFNKPRALNFKGMETFSGKLLHSAHYKTGKDFRGKKVLVAGFGNSACEIAIDLYEQGAIPFMTVRSPVNIVPRDILGIPVLQISLLMRYLPARLADKINAPLIELLLGNITEAGLKKLPYGPLEQIEKYGRIPVLDIGTLQHIRKGHISICGDIDHIGNDTVYFVDGSSLNADAIIAAIGYENNLKDILQVDGARLEDLKVSAAKQKYFGKEGLYFCGFWIAPTGQLREIARDAIKIAKDILAKEILAV
jgi:indole-3-pyruvate monooxygenase